MQVLVIPFGPATIIVSLNEEKINSKNKNTHWKVSTIILTQSFYQAYP